MLGHGLPRAAVVAGIAASAGRVGVRYRRARRAASVWQPPGGEHVRAGRLAVRVLGRTGTPIVLLHGLVGSGIFWGAAYDRLAERHRLVVPDLLGFGGSDRPSRGYRPDDHVDALIECLDALGLDEPVAVGAHSLGCLVGLRMAAAHSGRVTGLVGFGPPLYRTRADAKARIGASGPMARLFALPGPVAEHACDWLCRHHRMGTELAILTHPRLPRAVAADAVQHSWASYSQTLGRVILDAKALDWLGTTESPVRLVAGDHDPVVDHQLLRDVGAISGVEVEIWPGRHDLPLVEPERCATLIAGLL